MLLLLRRPCLFIAKCSRNIAHAGVLTPQWAWLAWLAGAGM
jgi:hypothetical protein